MALLESVPHDTRDAGWDVELGGRLCEPVQGRPLAVKRSLGNLVENAVRYGGRARIGTTLDSVADFRV